MECDATDTALTASTLCQSCGLCCAGVLFLRVRLEPDELPDRTDLNLVNPWSGTRKMCHPCQFLEGRGCGIYADRPSRCADYACTSRRLVLNGEKTLDESLEAVREIEAGLAALSPLVPRLDGFAETELKTLGFKQFCQDFAAVLSRKQKARTLFSHVEQEAVNLCFEIIKRVDRHLRGTSDLNRFAQFVMASHPTS